MKKSFVFMILIFLGACLPENKVEDTVYYIIPRPDTLKQNSSGAPPPPPVAFYGQHNFILYDSSRVFYHDNYVSHSCGMGIDFSKPPRLLLAADSLIEIKRHELPDFLKTIVLPTEKEHPWFLISISSSTDTIRNPAFEIIETHLKAHLCSAYSTRLWTEEEAFATSAKVEHRPYNPKTAEFKTGFDVSFVLRIDPVSGKELPFSKR